MGVTPIPHPASKNSSQNAPSVSCVYDLLYRLISESPAWVRVVVILALASAILLRVVRPTPAGIAQATKYPVVSGTQVPGPGNAEMQQATLRLTDDARHSRWHEDHPEDSPKLKMVFRISDDNYLAYKYYEKSDHCVFVIRRQNGAVASHWLPEPETRIPNAALGRPQPWESAVHAADVSVLGQLFQALVPSAQAAPLASFLQSTPHPSNAQADCVAGVHPGEFTWWWGTPEDQCWTPMYRQWKDGCKHYQRYNKCANAWDETIHWLSCPSGKHF